MGEFQLIEWLRQQQDQKHPGLVLGMGDDAAVLKLQENRELVITTDTLNFGVHFDESISPAALGHKSLAVNLSDLAAMGAKPGWALLSISMPSDNLQRQGSDWFKAFARGFLDLASAFGVSLIGGDTCAGSLSINVTAMGTVKPGTAVKRSGAKPGDLVVVSGTLGDAALALLNIQSGKKLSESARRALDRPVPRIALGSSLVGKATSCIDISDGLCADLGHITVESACAAQVEIARLPVSDDVALCDPDLRRQLQLSGGEDYELCFSFPREREVELAELSAMADTELTIIGEMVVGEGVRCILPDGTILQEQPGGFEHFR